MVGKGWLTSHVPVLNPFYARRDEIRVHLGCLMREIRVIVHPKLCPQAPEELHRGHLGGMKIKALPRRYIWWPGIHKEIEEAARTCSGWQLMEAEPSAGAIHLREWPSAPWQRIHVDFAGPFLGCMFLIVMDAHSRRLEVGKKRTPRPQRKPLRNCRVYSLDMVCHPSKLVTMGHSLHLRTFRCSSRDTEANIFHLQHTILLAMV